MSRFTPIIWFCLFVFQINPGSCQNPDYWSEPGHPDYWSEPGQNCDNPEEVSKLLNMNPSQCSIIRGKSDEQAFSLCKTHLNAKLEKKCEYSAVENPGELLYCKKRGELTCCFANESCATWSNIDSNIYTNAREYLMNKTNVLNNLVKITGYKTCHHLSSLDASKCANDCKKLEKGKFAKNCKSTGGLFKCCIRRDTRNCHECRYCCTLNHGFKTWLVSSS